MVYGNSIPQGLRVELIWSVTPCRIKLFILLCEAELKRISCLILRRRFNPLSQRHLGQVIGGTFASERLVWNLVNG